MSDVTAKSFQAGSLSQLAELLGKEDGAPLWVRELAMGGLLVAMKHRAVADAKSRDGTRRAIDSLSATIRDLERTALHTADFQMRRRAIVADGIGNK